MVTLRELPVSSSGVEEGSGSGFRAGQLDDQMRDFISAEIMRNIIDQTPVIFGSVREAIVELMDSHLEAFKAGLVSGQIGARLGPESYGVQGSIREGDPISSSCHQGAGVSGEFCLQERPLHDWIVEEVSRAIREDLPDMVVRITDRLIARLQDQTSVVQLAGVAVGVTQERESGRKSEGKRKIDETQVATGSGKRPKGPDLRTRNYQSRSRCGKCGRTHMGVCRRRSGGDAGCFKCGQIGHFSRDCVVTIAQGLDPLCFHCSQRGHKKAHCPSLYPAGQVPAPALGTSSTASSCRGRARVPTAQSRVFR